MLLMKHTFECGDKMSPIDVMLPPLVRGVWASFHCSNCQVKLQDLNCVTLLAYCFCHILFYLGLLWFV